jgi:hypothetical protein
MMWIALFVSVIGLVITYIVITMHRLSRKLKIFSQVEAVSMSPIIEPELSKNEEASPLDTRTYRFFKSTANFLKIIQDGAHLIKTVLQYLIGFTIVTILISQVWILAQNGKLVSANLEEEASQLLQIVAVGLIVSTAIELAYMLFTIGPDEAIDPVITALAAILLLRLPPPTRDTLMMTDISYARIIEILAYGILIVILFGVRELYLDGKLKRNEEKN